MYFLKEFCSMKDQTFASVLSLIKAGWSHDNPMEESHWQDGRSQPGTAWFGEKSSLDAVFTGDKTLDKGMVIPITDDAEKKQRKERLKRSIAGKYYQIFCMSPPKTRNSIMISASARLSPFSIPEMAALTSSDNIDLLSIGSEKTIIYVILSQAENKYNFLVSMLCSQIFDVLYCGKRSQ